MPKIVHCGLDYSGGGGGSGEANFIELSQSEYDELTYEEKHDPNKMYMITDGPQVEAQYFDPVIYSLEEREIGVWTDGKPLYQKTVIINNPSTASNISISDLSYDSCFVFDGYLSISGGSNLALNEDGRSWVHIYDNKIVWEYSSIYTGLKLVITIRYTKITDVPGSGQYTTLGVPSVHYSTDEQVIGTWIDGKPLYQKVVAGKTVSFSTTYGQLGYYTTVNFNNELSNIDTMWLDTVHSFYILNGNCRGFNFFANVGGTSMDIFVEANRSNVSCTFVLQYTKTTD